ncbi:hypothetical protein [Pseudonocardia abyssalis]|uniref:Uncharacterized protein n=1 Tax=Pseudonocardia abyssalis TaxID=2792008 RepID=A0ABS6UQ32_9PSEU|nr:hypothetical protein [Pseudonocardia abyssalis]MBW0114754.1 hypothetical protein [Pseudonocardia abyssalis]MBW0134361.1 hypothetical protein [Pseudonocardia abyssalis]
MDHGEQDHRLPPRREQLPLPRRDGRSHLEPQLRDPRGSGSGTPFAAFDAGSGLEAGPGGSAADASPGDASPGDDGPAGRAGTGADDPIGTAPPESRAAIFRAAVRRAVDRSSRRTG